MSHSRNHRSPSAGACRSRRRRSTSTPNDRCVWNRTRAASRRDPKAGSDPYGGPKSAGASRYRPRARRRCPPARSRYCTPGSRRRARARTSARKDCAGCAAGGADLGDSGDRRVPVDRVDRLLVVALVRHRREPRAVAREARITHAAHARGHRLRRARGAAGRRVDLDPPEVVAAAAIAREVEPASVGRPLGRPVGRRVPCHRDRLAARGRDRPEIALPLACSPSRRCRSPWRDQAG